MHIEINAGGLGAGIAVAEYQLNMSGFISDAESVISSFKAVSSKVYDLNGGVASLQGAVDDLSSRIQLEEEKKEAAITVQKKSNDFLDLAIRVDKQVASLVNKNKDEFYKTNPWLKPAVTVDDTPWYEDAWNWLCGKGEQIAEGIKSAWEWTKDTAKKAWDGLVEFYNEHKKIIDTVLIVVGAIGAIIAVVATGGVALVPLLGALGVSTTAAIAISTAVAVVAVVSTVASSALNIVDTWAEIDDPTFNAWQKGLNIVSAVSNLTYSVGTIYNSLKGINPQDYIAQNASKTASSAPPKKPQFSDLNEMTDSEYDCISKYNTDSAHFNDPVRSGKTTKDTRQLSKMIGERQLTADKKLYRVATLDDLNGMEIDNIDAFVNQPKPFKEANPFRGFMSTSQDPKLPKAVSSGNVFFEFSAPKGVNALDLSNLMYNEVIFDCPRYTIDLIEKVENGYKIFATILT